MRKLSPGAFPVHARACPVAPALNAKQHFVGKPDQRRAEHHGKVQLVLRQQGKAAERNQIHDRNLMLELDAICTGDGNAALLQLPDQLACQRLAARHQNHDVARRDGLFVAGQACAPVGPCLDTLRDVGRKLTTGLAGEGRSTGRCQRSVSGMSFGFTVGQKSTRPFAAARCALCEIGALPRRDAKARRVVGKHRVDELAESPAPSAARSTVAP